MASEEGTDVVFATRNIVLHTGNILNMNELIRKAGQNPTAELSESMKMTLEKWPQEVPGDSAIEIDAPNGHVKLDAEDRKDYKVAVKVFLCDFERSSLADAVTSVMTELGTDLLDSVIVSYPLWKKKIESIDLRDVWGLLEEYVKQEKVASIGVSDLDTDVFVELYEWANIKPTIVQINLATCCAVPPELASFAKEHGIQLLTHSDPLEIMPDSVLQSVVGPKVGSSKELKARWLLRFQVHVKCRGVLSHKGYVTCLLWTQ